MFLVEKTAETSERGKILHRRDRTGNITTYYEQQCMLNYELLPSTCFPPERNFSAYL